MTIRRSTAVNGVVRNCSRTKSVIPMTAHRIHMRNPANTRLCTRRVTDRVTAIISVLYKNIRGLVSR